MFKSLMETKWVSVCFTRKFQGAFWVFFFLGNFIAQKFRCQIPESASSYNTNNNSMCSLNAVQFQSFFPSMGGKRISMWRRYVEYFDLLKTAQAATSSARFHMLANKSKMGRASWCLYSILFCCSFSLIVSL